MNNNDEPNILKIAFAVAILFISVNCAAIFFRLGLSYLNIVTSRLAGQAAFAHSESERKVLVSQAEAELEAAKLRAEAIKIVGEMAQKYPEYREQEFIGAFGEALRSDKIDQIIYVTTEANIPIIERKR
jgi:hypothetical protein